MGKVGKEARPWQGNEVGNRHRAGSTLLKTPEGGRLAPFAARCGRWDRYGQGWGAQQGGRIGPGSAKDPQANNKPDPTSRAKTQVRRYDRRTVNVCSLFFKATGSVFQSVDGNVRSTPGNLTPVMCLIC